MFRIYSELCGKNIKLFLLPAVCSAMFLAAILFIITEPQNCSAVYAARICQEFFAWTGIFLLSPVFMPEQRDNIEESILSKAVPIKAIYLIRLAEALTALVLFAAGVVWILLLLGAEIEFKRYFIHTFATALLLGSLGFAGTRFSGNIGVGYIIAFGFYIIQMFLPDEIIEKAHYIFIFTLRSETYSSIPIFIFSIVFIGVSFLKKH